MKSNRIPHCMIPLVIMLVIIVSALWLRVVLPYNQVFVADWVKMTGVDAYYYMRLVDNLVRHFPQLTQFDPHMQYPGGAITGSAADFFAYFMAGIIWLLGMGHPDQHMVDMIAVYIPPVLAVLTIIAVYFIGRALGSGWIGLMAAGLLAIMPGEFLNRSLLGYTDHHIAEVLFSTLMMLFVFEYIRLGDGKALVELRQGSRGLQARLLIYGVLGGVFLWLYMLTWQGALMFVMIMIIYQVIQAVVDHVRSRSVDYLGILGICVYGAALALYVPWMKGAMTAIMLGIGLLISLFLMVLSGLMVKKQIRVVYYPVSIMVAGIVGLIAMKLLNPLMFDTMLGYATAIFGWNATTTVMEMQPLLIHQGQFTLLVVFGNYMLAFILSIVGIGVLIYDVVKGGTSGRMLLLAWSVFVLMSALGMRRFAYYYAVNVALLSGIVCWISLSWAISKMKGKTAIVEQRVQPARKKKKRIATREQPGAKKNVVIVTVMIAAILLVVYYPNVGPLPNGEKPSVDLATRPLFAPSNAWCETLDWLKDNTAEPFGEVTAYYDVFKPLGQQKGFEYPASSYSVLAWWDYGYWITRIGRRIPSSNPGVGNVIDADYFTAQEEYSAARLINNYGTKYVIVDNEIARYDGKFHALATLSGGNYSDYFELVAQKQGDRLTPVIVFYPEFYRSMVVRLYNFDGQPFTPDSVNVVRVQERTTRDGQKYKEIVESRKFKTYNEATFFIKQQKSMEYRISSNDPTQSPVPLDGLRQYKLVHVSNQKTAIDQKSTAMIKVYEYNRDVLPVAGDWNNSGKTGVGIWQPETGLFWLDRDGDGKWEPDKGDAKIGPFGYATDVPLTGDWNGDGCTEIGVWRPSDSCCYLDFNGDGLWNPARGDVKLGPFLRGFKDIPVVGDWNGDGKFEVGIWRYVPEDKGMYFFLDISGDGYWDEQKGDLKLGPFGKTGDVPVTGDWTGEGRTKIGVWEPASQRFLLDMDGNGKLDPAKGDIVAGPFGDSIDIPLSGHWEGGKKDLAGMWDPKNRAFILNVKGDYSLSDFSNIKVNQFSGN